MPSPQPKSDADWKRDLTPEQYRVLREAGTEAAVLREAAPQRRSGHVLLRGVRRPLFKSETKFDSGLRLAELLRTAHARRGGLAWSTIVSE